MAASMGFSATLRRQAVPKGHAITYKNGVFKSKECGGAIAGPQARVEPPETLTDA